MRTRDVGFLFTSILPCCPLLRVQALHDFMHELPDILLRFIEIGNVGSV